MPTASPYGSLGGKKDAVDLRDHWYDVPARFRRRLPTRVDLREQCPPIYQQGKLESCSAHAVAAAMWFHAKHHAQDGPAIRPSRLFIYYNSRRMAHNVPWNAPVSLRDCYKAVRKWGACRERLWPYEVGQLRVRPPDSCYVAGHNSRVIKYERLRRDLLVLRACLAEGHPFALGISLFESFTSPDVRRTGIVPMPRASESEAGGHAVLAVGYDDARERFILRNSWGARWADHGHFYLPYAFFTRRTKGRSLAWDFWTVRG